jgi:hypothetical protein
VTPTHNFSSSATIPLAILTSVIFLAPVPQIYKVSLMAPHVALDSSMACRVFRGLKLGFIEEIDENSVQSSRAQSRRSRFEHTPAIFTTVVHLDMPVPIGLDSTDYPDMHLDEKSQSEPSVDKHADGYDLAVV